uniref:NADH-ubiquinone oxidoreductase chain 5 n=1 Tax=Parajapyx emeryanus TaxID=165473 RepID=U3KTL8_9HEXA|nr:NADH dehydrogenase subunit 5 [Parajapyx emeryanus]AEV44854.1 NADH dehydrogenase subunit 5 [Parajapyx emeryanus]
MVFSFSICFVSMMFLLFFSLGSLLLGVYSLVVDYSLFLDWEFLSLNGSSVVMTFVLDWVSLFFLSFVMLISSMVIMYSDSYMHGDYNINRFILVVLLFVASMLFLIVSPNIISVLLGWDGLGLVSYCLVIYYQNVRSYNAGMLTALSNRIGDVAILLGIGFFSCFGGFNFIFYLALFKEDWVVFVVTMLAVLAAMTKSAQIPFSAWLPAAMAAPTPVSALVHSSTLVTAGVYLLIRFFPSIEGTLIQVFLLFVASFTMFMSGLGANFETDLKKIIALSTLSQLGVMLLSLSMGFVYVCYFHLLAHAFFKSLLFLCAGVIIHNVSDFQDVRSMGGLSFNMPLVLSCFNVSNLALCGMPFLAGFYSKDLIIELCSLSTMNYFMFFILMLSTGLTVSYSFRLAYISMFGGFNVGTLSSIGDEDRVMTSPMLLLTAMSCVAGALLSWFIFPVPSVICLPLFMSMGAVIVSVIGVLAGLLLSMVRMFGVSSLYYYFNSVSWFFGSMWFMPFISTRSVSVLPLGLGEHYYKMGDHGWSELAGGQGLYYLSSYFSMITQWFQDNSLSVYFYTFGFWLVILLMAL